ncbi:MAG: sel1 repeat family protein [Rhodospirillales bacterium]|nr:sel1 repeat family protein [Rhodospirillales bacterium]
MKALEDGNHTIAVNMLESARINGDMRAAMVLARLYEEGEDVNRDPTKACDRYIKAGEAGNVDAQYAIVNCYDSGHAISTGTDQLKWLEGDAGNGHVATYCEAELFYAYGNVVEQDRRKALELCLQDALAGDVPAMDRGAGWFWRGDGTKCNIEQAVRLGASARSTATASRPPRIWGCTTSSGATTSRLIPARPTPC